jgi:hypothetical protein
MIRGLVSDEGISEGNSESEENDTVKPSVAARHKTARYGRFFSFLNPKGGFAPFGNPYPKWLRPFGIPGNTYQIESIMAANSFSDYRRAARHRWPNAAITGDGPFALVCSITSSVTLYSFHMLAMTEIALDHSNWRCKDSHHLIELKPEYRTRRVFRNHPDREP